MTSWTVDAAVGEPGDRSFEEPDGGDGAFVGEDLDVGEAGGVIDADVDGFPARPGGCERPGPAR